MLFLHDKAGWELHAAAAIHSRCDCSLTLQECGWRPQDQALCSWLDKRGAGPSGRHQGPPRVLQVGHLHVPAGPARQQTGSC